jgi:hypothetical protein
MDSRKLDAWIMGLNDPSAPFNQVDWSEISPFCEILEECNWLGDDTLIDNYDEIGALFLSVCEEAKSEKFPEVYDENIQDYIFYATQKDIDEYILSIKCELANKIKSLWETRNL